MNLFKKLSALAVLLVASFTLVFFINAVLPAEKPVIENSGLHKVDNPEELGLVQWERSYAKAVEKSQATNKPIFLLFQRVPGCANCTRFGSQVLSNPLLVDAIEHEFVPLCIYNNRGGEDARVLKQFGEPSWNNPVVRIIDANGKDLTKRMGRFHPLEVVNGMVNGLAKAGKTAPEYLKISQEQITGQFASTETAYFSMYCFWSGELKLGPINGVVGTTSGFMGGREVVKVDFNPAKVSYEQLLKQARAVKCTDKAFAVNGAQKQVASSVLGADRVKDAKGFSVDREPKYYMSHTAYKFVPMTPIQRIKVNRAIYDRQSPNQYLSPSQIKLYASIKNNNSGLEDLTLSTKLVEDWEKFLDLLASN